MKLHEYEALIKPPKKFLRELEIGDKFRFVNLSNGIAEKRWVYQVVRDVNHSRAPGGVDTRPLRDICQGCGSYYQKMSIESKFKDEEVELLEGNEFHFEG